MIVEQSAFHELTDELRGQLEQDAKLIEAWNSLTDIQRNEWICWTTMAKQQATRDKRLNRAIEELAEGKKDPLLLARVPASSPKRCEVFQVRVD